MNITTIFGGYDSMALPTFKRNFYPILKNSCVKNKVTFVLGPRKSGKTIALRQLHEELANSIYVDIKQFTIEQSDMFIQEVCDSIRAGSNKIYLIDEATYLNYPDRCVEEIALALADNPATCTRVVLTGSQSRALQYWGNRSFCGNACFIETDFLNYAEWLEYKGITDISEQTYIQFLLSVDEFYEMSSIEKYLAGCLQETIISNSKTLEVILGNSCDLLTVDILLDILFAALVTLHNHVSYLRFRDKMYLDSSIKHFFKNIYDSRPGIADKIISIVSKRYKHLQDLPETTLRQALVFLVRSGLLTITEVSDRPPKGDICVDLLSLDPGVSYKDNLFEHINICIRHPMFYIGILKMIFSECELKYLSRELLGSIVECHARGLLSRKYCYEYHNMQDDSEIDYVNFDDNIAAEFSVGNNHKNNFSVLPPEYRCYLLTRDKSSVRGNVEYVPYYKFLYELSSRILER